MEKIEIFFLIFFFRQEKNFLHSYKNISFDQLCIKTGVPIKFKDTILSSQQFKSYTLVLMPDPKFRFQIESAAQGNRLAKLPLYHSSSSDFIKLPLDIRTFDTWYIHCK